VHRLHLLAIVIASRLMRLPRILLILSAVAAAWTVALTITGGFTIRLGSIRLSSHNPRTAALAAVIGGIAAWMLATPEERRNTRQRLLTWTRGEQRWPWWIEPATMVAMIGGGLQLYQWARARPLWLDEEMIALNLRDRTLADLAGALWLGQSAPLGWLAVQRVVLLMFGTSELALRFVPVLFGTATLAWAVWVGRRWMGPVGAAVLVLLCSFGQWIAYYSLELKHYSADAFWGLLLPTLAAWAVEKEPENSAAGMRRVAAWWVAAAVGHWFANGALLVTPACALALFVMVARRSGLRSAVHVISPGLIWVASFGLHYMLTVRHTLRSEYLQEYWSFAMPSASTGLKGTLAWLAGRLEPFAWRPGGTHLWVAFWLTAACGFAVSSVPTVSIMVATIPLSAFLFAALRIVPLYERLSLWAVPALYLGTALFADSAMRFGRLAYVRRSWVYVIVTAIVVLLTLPLCADVVQRGMEDLLVWRSNRTNHQLDDRGGVRALIQQRQPGDVVITTRLALPALWWYGNIPISNPDAASGHAAGSPVLVVGYAPLGPNCRPDALREALQNRRRVLIYFGFRFNDVPSGFDDLLLDSLDEMGAQTKMHVFPGVGRLAVVELRPSHGADPVVAQPRTRPADRRRDGCLTIRTATRW
jgi:hypothetical protein